MFCGTSLNKERLASVEKLNIHGVGGSEWVELKLQVNPLWRPQAWISCIPLSPKEILLFRCDDDEVNFVFEVESLNLRTYKAKG